MVEVTSEFIEAVRAAATALINDSYKIETDPLFDTETGVGKILRVGVERQRQQAALLRDWCDRAMSPTGLKRDAEVRK